MHLSEPIRAETRYQELVHSYHHANAVVFGNPFLVNHILRSSGASKFQELQDGGTDSASALMVTHISVAIPGQQCKTVVTGRTILQATSHLSIARIAARNIGVKYISEGQAEIEHRPDASLRRKMARYLSRQLRTAEHPSHFVTN